MTITFSEATLRRKVWLDQACAALLDYRDPGHEVTAKERDGLAVYIESNVSPADAAEMFQAATGALLFNCCTDNAAPAWSQFKSLEIGGCITETEPNGDTFTIGGKSDDEAEFWTVYARHHSGEAEAITDCSTRAAADETGKALSDLSGLPLL